MHILYRSTNKHQTILVSICLTVRNKSTTNNKNGTALSKTILLHRVVLHLVELTYFDYHVLSSSSSSGASAGSSCCLPLVPLFPPLSATSSGLPEKPRFALISSCIQLGSFSNTPISGSSRRNTVVGFCSSAALPRSEEHTSELQSLMRISYAVFFFK